MNVYPQSKVFCPQNLREQDGNKCAPCPHYGGHENGGGIIYVDCRLLTDSYPLSVSTSLLSQELVEQAHLEPS